MANFINSPSHCVVIGNDKGGVAKDLTAEGLKIALGRLELDHQLIELESQKRLGVLYPDTVFIKATAIGADELYANPDLVFEPMDQLSVLVRSKPISVVCLGANLTSGFLRWAETNGSRCFGDGAGLHFVCLLTMNRAALAAGLENLFDFTAQFPAARRTAVLNEFAAPFVDGDRNLAKRLREAQGSGEPIETLKLTRMAAPAWGYLQNLGPLADVAKMPAQRLIDLGLPEGPAIRSMAMFEKWLENELVAPLSTLLPRAGEQ
jgi:hypothetical protein